MSAHRGLIVVMSLAAVVLWPSSAAAQLSHRDGSTGDLSLAVGRKVSVTTTDGQTVKGQVLGLTPTTLDIGKGGVVTTSVAIADLRRVSAADSVANGVITGALSLGAVGLLVGGLADAGNAAGDAFGNFFVLLLGGEPPPIHHTHHYVTGAVAGVAVGALVGYALDAGKEKTLYMPETGGMSVAVHPIVSTAGKGLSVQVKW